MLRLCVAILAAMCAPAGFAAAPAPSPPCAAPVAGALPLESLCFSTLATAAGGVSVRAYAASIGAVTADAPDSSNFTSSIAYGIEAVLPYFYRRRNLRHELISRTTPIVVFETDPTANPSWHTFMGLPASHFPNVSAAPQPLDAGVALAAPFVDATRLVAALRFATAAAPSEAQWRAACKRLLAGLPAGYAPAAGAPLALALYDGRDAAAFVSECWASVVRGGGGGDEPAPVRAPPAMYTNPVVLGDVPDPGLIRVNGTWMVATTGGDGGGSYFAVHTSADLAAWAPQGYLFSAATWPRWADGTAWAPEVHEVSPGSFVVYFVSKVGGVLAVGAASASSPTGPFTDRGAPLVRAPAGACFGVIDPTFWRAPSGERFVVYKHDGNSCGQHTDIFAAPLSADGLNVTGHPTLLITNDAPWEGGCTEAPWVVQRGKYTFLFYTGSVYNQPSYAVGVARSEAGILGPFVKNAANPLLRSAPGAVPGNSRGLHYGPGHVSVAALDSGEYALVYAAEEASGSGRRNIMLDAIVWTADGWPAVAGGVPSDTPQPVPV